MDGGQPLTRPRPSTGDRLVYAIGDIHGRYDLLKQLLTQATADLRKTPGTQPMLVFCGDYVDRGPQSAEVVEALLWLKRRADLDVRLLKGNHEQGLLAYIDSAVDGFRWLEFGGRETLLSYGVRPPDDPANAPDNLRARDELLQRMPASHLNLLENLETMVVVGDYAFVHAGVRPGVPLQAQAETDLLWIRDDFLTFEDHHEKMIVHGHTWRDDRPQMYPHRIGIDTGAYATGVLSALRLQGEAATILQARMPRIDLAAGAGDALSTAPSPAGRPGLRAGRGRSPGSPASP